MNRSNILFVLVFVTGCGSVDYGLGSQTDDNLDPADLTVSWSYDGEAPDDTSHEQSEDVPEESVTDSPTETEEIPEETEPTNPCDSSAVHYGRDIYGNNVWTSAMPEVTVYTTFDYSDGIHQGEFVSLRVQINSLDGCGETFTLREINIQLSDNSPGAVWLNSLWADNKGQSNLAELSYDADGNLTNDHPFPPAFMNTYGFGLDANHQPVSGGTSYVWAGPESAMCAQTGNYVVDIPTQTVGATGKLYEFSWPFGSSHVPTGEKITFDVTFGWNDDATGYQMESKSWGQLTVVKL